MVPSVGGDLGVGQWELQTIGYKIGYKDLLYNTGEYSQYFLITVNGV